MNKKYTQLSLVESAVRQAVKGESFPEPAKKTLHFLKDFAHNFRVEHSVSQSLQSFVLN